MYDSFEDYRGGRSDGPATPRELVLEDAELALRASCRTAREAPRVARPPSSRSSASSRRPAAAGDAPRADALIHAPAYGLVREEHLAAYADRVETVAVPGMHMVMWDAFDEVADAVERFLENPRAER